ncbi:MAG: Gfo/Idh/MocA family oxidoreductase [Chloroflexi bacterium]|nr:Gfo/Idh/MocA family oxidoreductase [Chloroflexota bacterium]
MDKVRLAVIGCGTISQLNVPGYLKHAQCEVYAVCDPVRERAERRAKEWGIEPRIYTRFEDVLEDPTVDAVELLTPTHLHHRQALAALAAGKHVSCQKPVSLTVSEADEIGEAAKHAGVLFRVTENFIYYPPLVKAKEMLDGGVIGEPSMIRIRTVAGPKGSSPDYSIDPGALEWRRDPALNAGGALFDDGWHKYATAIWMLGDVEKVQAMVTKTDDYVIEAPSSITWKFKDRNCLAVIDYASALEMEIRSKYFPLDEFFEIQGSKGTIWVTRCSGQMLDLPPVMLHTGSETESIDVPSDWIEGFNGAAADFIDCIVDGGQPSLDAETSKKVLQVTLAAYEAGRLERSIDPSAMV